MDSRFENIFFDLDGTLVDSLPGIEYSIDTALSKTGLRRSIQDVRPLLGPPIRIILGSVAKLDGGKELDALERSFRSSYDSSGWQKTACYPGMLDALRELRGRGKRLFLATNKPAVSTRLVVEFLGIAPYLEESVSPDSRMPPYSSKGEMLLYLIDRYRLDPSRCLMVGDTASDYEAARSAGVDAVIMSHGYGIGAGKAPVGRKINHFDDLVSLVLG